MIEKFAETVTLDEASGRFAEYIQSYNQIINDKQRDITDKKFLEQLIGFSKQELEKQLDRDDYTLHASAGEIARKGYGIETPFNHRLKIVVNSFDAVLDKKHPPILKICGGSKDPVTKQTLWLFQEYDPFFKMIARKETDGLKEILKEFGQNLVVIQEKQFIYKIQHQKQGNGNALSALWQRISHLGSCK